MIAWIFPSTVDRCNTGTLIRNAKVQTETDQIVMRIFYVSSSYSLDITVGNFHLGIDFDFDFILVIPK